MDATLIGKPAPTNLLMRRVYENCLMDATLIGKPAPTNFLMGMVQDFRILKMVAFEPSQKTRCCC
jgi:hypothetical protein